MKKLVLMCSVLCLASSLSATADWPSFKGRGALGVGVGTAPTTWDVPRSVNVRWKRPIPGLGHSSPVIWGDRMFVTTAVPAGKAEYLVGLEDGPNLLTPAVDNQRYSWRVIALDTRTGKELWQKTLSEGLPRSVRHTKNSFASPTAATDGRRLVVYFGSEGLHCLDLDGTQLWSKDLGVLRTGFYQDHSYQWGAGSSPILYKNLAIVQVDTDDDQYIAAFDLKTGERVWKAPRSDGQSWSTPTIYMGPPEDVLVTNAPRHVRGYDPATGRELWRFLWDLEIVLSTPTVANGLIYASSGKGKRQPILAIRPGARGDITLHSDEESNEGVVWSTMRGGPIITSPLVYDDYLYALVDLGILRCFHARTGKLQYEERILDSFLSSPVAADGKVYLTAETGDVYVLNAGPSYELISVNPLGEPTVATPAFANGMMFIRTIHHVLAIAEGPAAATPARSSR